MEVDQTMQSWADTAKEHIKLTNTIYGYSWGDPNSYGGELGNYRKIRDEYVIPNCLSGTVMDLGALSGKWTQYMRFADRVIYADCDLELFYMTKYLLNINIEFCHINGKDLNNINDKSIDFLLVMDSFMRISKEQIEAYIIEIKRVLSKTGKALIMLPVNEKNISRGFTSLSLEDINTYMNNCEFNYTIDMDTITHGYLILINF